MLLDVIKVVSARIFQHMTWVLSLAGFAGLAGSLAIIAGILRADLVIDAIASSVGTLPALRALIDKFGSARDRRIGEERAIADHALEYSVLSGFTIVRRILFVTTSMIFLISLFFSAHELGSREGGQVVNGRAVDMTVFGFNIPSITATAVSIKPVGSSSTLKKLAKDKCWLQIGSNPGVVLLYDPTNKSTITVPSDQVIVISSAKSCPKLSVFLRLCCAILSVELPIPPLSNVFALAIRSCRIPRARRSSSSRRRP
jgi:uncharacterized membrane protein YtjA (UPF0391 family)